MNVEEMVQKAKQDTEKVFQMMNTHFDKKIETLHDWMIVNNIIANVLNMDKTKIIDDMTRSFIDEFNQRIESK